MSSRMQTDLIKRALQQAIINRNPERGLIHHSDRGSQYTSADFKRKIDQHEMILSMSGKGNCYDNAVVESFFHSAFSTLKCDNCRLQSTFIEDLYGCTKL